MRAEHLAMGLAGRSPLYHTQAANQSLAQKSPTPRREQERRDVASISPMQRANNMIEAIRKQKQNIIEAKKQLIITHTKEGKDLKQIEPMLDSYNELLQTLDEQIVSITASMVQQNMAELEKAKEKLAEQKDEEPKTREELEARQLNSIASAADQVKQTQTVSSVQDKVKGELQIKKSELALDGLTIDNLKSKRVNVKDMVASNRRMMDKKKLAISSLEDRAAQLALQQGKGLKAAAAQLEEAAQPHEVIKDENGDGSPAAPPAIREGKEGEGTESTAPEATA